VLNQLIDSTIVKDREFVAWRAEQPAGAATQPNAPDHAGTARADAKVAR